MQEKPFFIYHTLKIQKLPGLRPGPRWGSSRRSPRPPSRVGRAPLPTPLPLATFGASLSKKRLRRLFNTHKRTPPFLKSWIRPCCHICFMQSTRSNPEERNIEKKINSITMTIIYSPNSFNTAKFFLIFETYSLFYIHIFRILYSNVTNKYELFWIFQYVLR